MQRIIHPPKREVFEARVRQLCTRAWTRKVMRAWDICGEVHVKPRTDGSLYYNHPRAAAWILIQIAHVHDPRRIIQALLHDTGEEKVNPFTSDDVEREFNDAVITSEHRAITKLPNQHPREYSAQVFSGGIKLVIVKFCDRLHNHWTLEACDFEKQNRIIADTWMYYYPYNGEYKEFLKGASKKDRQTIDFLWELINEAIEELLAKR